MYTLLDSTLTPQLPQTLRLNSVQRIHTRLQYLCFLLRITMGTSEYERTAPAEPLEKYRWGDYILSTFTTASKMEDTRS